MTITKKIKNNIAVFYIKGEINIDTAVLLKKITDEMKKDDLSKIVLNLCDVQYIDSFGMSLLIELKNKVEKNEGQVFLSNLSPKIISIFGITKLEKLFKIYEKEAQALKDFSINR